MRKQGAAAAAAAVILLYMVMEGLGITCPIRFLTGVSCAGCGMSRAWLSLLRLDFAAAFRFHPLFALVVPGALLVLLRSKVSKKVFQWGLAVFCGLFLAVYVARLLDPGDAVVVCEPSQGLIWRVVSAAVTRQAQCPPPA